MGVTREMGLATGVGLIFLLITEINPSPSLSSDLWNMRLEYDQKDHKSKDETIDDPKNIQTIVPDTEAEETISNWNFEDDMSVKNEESKNEQKTDPPGNQESHGHQGFESYFDEGTVEVESDVKKTTRKPWTLHRDEEFLRQESHNNRGDLGFGSYFDVGAADLESRASETTRKPWTLHRDEEFFSGSGEMGNGRRQVSTDGGSHSSNGGSHSPNGWEVRVGTDISVNM